MSEENPWLNLIWITPVVVGFGVLVYIAVTESWAYKAYKAVGTIVKGLELD